MNSKTTRLIIPFLALVLGFFVVYSMFKSTKPKPRPVSDTPAETVQGEEDGNADDLKIDDDPAGETLPSTDLDEEAGNEDEPANEAGGEIDAAPELQPASIEKAELPKQPINLPVVAGLHFKAQPPVTNANFMPMGDFGDEAVNPARMVLEMSPRGAGIHQITLLDYYRTTNHVPENRYTLLDGIPENRPALGLRAIQIDGQRLDASGIFALNPATNKVNFVAPVWAEEGSDDATTRIFTAEILDADDQPVMRITRVFELGAVPGQLTIKQKIENLSAVAHDVAIEQWGPADLPTGGGYGDFRRFRFGYTDDRTPEFVFADEGDYLKQRNSIIGKRLKANSNVIWPNDASIENNYSLSWAGVTNRYFAFVAYPYFADPANAPDKRTKDIAEVQFLLDSPARRLAEINPDQVATIYANLKLISPTWSLPAGGTHTFDLGAYAGPQLASLLAKTEPYRSFKFSEFIVYQLGCALCTFQWLADILISFLRMIHGIVRDWGISIIILVLVVRGLLHPLTKKGQVSMQRMQKKMGKLQPEISKLKEKYKDNPKKLQKEQMVLYREHNVNPAGCLGMAPMFLQMPIWVALYAMLYFAIELRQEPFGYGIFQIVNNWTFLADLSQPDKFIDFGGPISFLRSVPLLNKVTSLNVLPLLMGAFFYFQQKYMTPPNPNATPEQETQQKIMRVIFPLMWPIFLYVAPAGLTLYIMTSSCIGIIESRYIRAHVSALDDNGNEPTGGPGSSPEKKKGFASRIMSSYSSKIEEAQKVMEQKAQGKQSGGGPTPPSRNKKGGYSKRKPDSK